MASLKKLSPLPIRFSGVGGSLMAKQGLTSLFPIEDISVMGIWELLPHINKIRAKLKATIEAALLFQPHVVVTVDNKGFSFRLLKKLRVRYNQLNLDGPVHFHYVAPSFWAWKGGEARLKGLTEFVDHVLCILPFEEGACRANGLGATFVGHPIVEDVMELNSERNSSPCKWKIEGKSEDFKEKNAIPSGATVVSLLPGSRLQEVTRMLTIFANTMDLLKESFPELVTVIHIAPNRHVESYIGGIVSKWPVPAILVPGGSPHLKYDALSASKVSLCTSGTVAVEMQLSQVPCVVAYRAHFLTEWFVRYKAKIRYASLPNILMDSAIIPEAFFHSCTHTKLATLLTELIHNDHLREEQIAAAEKVIRLLLPPERTINNLGQQDLMLSFPIQSPSMLAAFLILYHEKQ
ncbi:probable lipid-A-disaccharide synthase, mitochondrial isoform X2 [Humulus lupulus]|nr:probable lipid-A-disaccharide synthase, mitochondrial isoform X2 [Humulus lupulus]XP_062107293.1 probable lipid-A-disaccharide synthase, mitochondrial isoform X2 [Humulus lupulus]